jgi:hypothetical protein
MSAEPLPQEEPSQQRQKTELFETGSREYQFRQAVEKALPSIKEEQSILGMELERALHNERGIEFRDGDVVVQVQQRFSVKHLGDPQMVERRAPLVELMHNEYSPDASLIFELNKELKDAPLQETTNGGINKVAQRHLQTTL